MITTVLDNGKLVKPSTEGIEGLEPFFKIKKTDTSGKVDIAPKVEEDWAEKLVPVRKSEKKSVVINGVDTATLATKKEARQWIKDAINEFETKVSNNRVTDTFKELIDYAAEHKEETIEIYADVQKNKENIEETNKTLQENVSTLNTYIETETSSRENADKELTKKVNAVSNGLTDEVSARENAIDLESTARKAKDEELTKAIADEKKVRASEIDTVKKLISTEVTARETAIKSEEEARKKACSDLTNALSTEVTARKDAISTEVTARETAIKKLTDDLSTETTARESAISDEEKARIDVDTALNNKIEEEIKNRETAISDEAAERLESDEAIIDKIEEEIENRETAISNIETAISDEATARETKDTELEEKFDNYYTLEETDEAIETATQSGTVEAAFASVEVLPKESENYWKAGVKLGELNGNKNLLLFKKSTKNNEKSFIGGELLIEMDDGESIDHHNISLTSTGSVSYSGASDSFANSNLFQCRYNGEKYYGISLPNIEYREDSTYNTVNINQSVGFRIVGSNYNWVIGFGTSGSTGSDIYSTVGQRAWAYSNWSYFTVKDFLTISGVPAVAAKNSFLAKYYDTGYIYFYVRVRNEETVEFSIRDIVVSDRLGWVSYKAANEETYYNPINGVSIVKNENEEINSAANAIFNWNSDFLRLDGTSIAITIGSISNNWSGWGNFLYTYKEKVTYEIPGAIIEKKPNNAKFFFNGWFKEEESLKPPVEYSDNDLYEIITLKELSEKSIIVDGNGGLVPEEALTKDELALVEPPNKTLEVKTASGNTISVSGISTSRTFTDIAETCEISEIIEKGQQLKQGITFQYLPLKNKMIITEGNTFVYPFSTLSAQNGDFNCQAGIYRLIQENGQCYLKCIATTNKERIIHNNGNYLEGARPYLTFLNVKESLINPAKYFYYVGLFSNYRTDMLGTSYWIDLTDNISPCAAYYKNVSNFNNANLNDDDLQQILCETTDTQINYIRIVNGD